MKKIIVLNLILILCLSNIGFSKSYKSSYRRSYSRPSYRKSYSKPSYKRTKTMPTKSFKKITKPKKAISKRDVTQANFIIGFRFVDARDKNWLTGKVM